MKKLSTLVSYAILCLLLTFSSTTFATNYYVDPSSGSSVANGTLASPWKTIAQVNSGTTLLNPGDTVFFKRGQTYSGRLTVPRSGIAGRPIVYTPYGTGALPEFNNNVSNVIVLSNRQYVVINGIKIIDRSIEYSDPNHQLDANIDYAINLYNSSHCTISNCDLSLVGVGISTNAGCDYTTITGNYMHNMRMVKNAPGGNDDYGANPMVIGSSYNTITNNRFEECWALSYDFGYDGGAVELFGNAMNNNLIMYNTAINCNGFMEIGSYGTGVANNNIVAYNKIINCGSIGTYQTGGTFATSINNLQYYNNIVIETVRQYARPAALFWMYTSGPQGMVVAKNNIFWLSTGINFASSKFNAGEMVHTNNIYRMSSGVLGVTLNSSEQYSTNASNLFSTTSGDPATWNVALQSSSPAINFGTGVGLTRDFAGAAIVGNPDAGILESNSTAPVAPVALNATATAAAINCNGGNTTVTVAATGGKTPYTGIGTFSVTAGTYNYIVTDANGAKDTATITLAQPTVIAATLTAGSITTAGGTTSISVAASGGTAPYTYSLNGGAYQSTNTFSNVVAGTHSVVTRDSKACTITKSITIIQPAATNTLNATATAAAINCNGGTTTVTVAATGGTSPYSGTGSFTVTAGTYNYYVTDASGAKDTATITVSQPTAINATLSAGAISTTGGTTTITVAASGGTSPYTYSLNGSAYQSVNTFSSVVAGTYSVITRDSKGCTITKSITITQSAVLNATATAGTINCYGGTTTVTVAATGGKSPYTGTGTFTVSAGTYNYYISDANGAKDTATISIAQPTAINATVTAGTINTSGGTTTITVAASGGASPYTFSLNGGAYQSTNTFSNVVAGTYVVVTRDAKGCTISRSISIAQTLALQATATALPISCYGGTTIVTVKATGGKTPYYNTHDYTESAGVKTYIVIDANGARDTVSITLTQPTAINATVTAGTITTTGGTTTIAVSAAGGTSPYTYSLNGGAYQASNSFANVVAGTYSIVVKDSKGCTLSKSIAVTTSLVAPLTATVTAGTISCYGGTTTVTVKATGGKTPYYNTHDYTESAGVKTYVVIDANGTRDTVSITIPQPAALAATLTAGSNSISVAASGGTSPYTYSLDGGLFQTSNTFSNVTLGTHAVVVKDAKGCTTSKSISLADPKLTVSTNNSFLIQAYPNPSTSSFSVAIVNGGFQAVTLTVFNELGTVVYNAKGSANSIFRFGGSFIPGMYFLKVTNGGVSQTVQLVKM